MKISQFCLGLAAFNLAVSIVLKIVGYWTPNSFWGEFSMWAAYITAMLWVLQLERRNEELAGKK